MVRPDWQKALKCMAGLFPVDKRPAVGKINWLLDKVRDGGSDRHEGGGRRFMKACLETNGFGRERLLKVIPALSSIL